MVVTRRKCGLMGVWLYPAWPKVSLSPKFSGSKTDRLVCYKQKFCSLFLRIRKIYFRCRITPKSTTLYDCPPFLVFSWPICASIYHLMYFDCVQLLTGTIHAGLRESGQLLEIESAMMSHEGQYTCVVTNSAGEDKRDFHVTIQGVCLNFCIIVG